MIWDVVMERGTWKNGIRKEIFNVKELGPSEDEDVFG
jgi:hypothetical protein